MFLFSLEVEDLWKIFDRNRVQVKSVGNLSEILISQKRLYTKITNQRLCLYHKDTKHTFTDIKFLVF